MRRLIFCLVGVLALGACASAHSFRIEGAPTYEPTSADTMETYVDREDLPCDDFERLARLEGSGDWSASKQKIWDEMRDEAAEYGANAILVTGFSDTSFGEQMGSGGEKHAIARGIAIRLKCNEDD